MEVLAPKQLSSADMSACLAAAEAGQEPIFAPTQWFVDDRGTSLMNQLQGVMSAEGQMNFTTINPGVVKAWHRHAHQTDFWLCVSGHVKVGVHRESDGRCWEVIFGERRPGVLVIPPLLWHGVATAGAGEAGVIYYVTKAYDTSAPDEQRREFDSVPGFSWGTVFR